MKPCCLKTPEIHVIKKRFTKQNIVLAGGFNLNISDYEENKNIRDFVKLMFNFGMISTINKTTCVTEHSTTTIYHIHTNSVLNTKIQAGIIETVSQYFQPQHARLT